MAKPSASRQDRVNKNARKNRAGASLPATAPAGPYPRWIIWGVCIFLAVITLAVFGQTFSHPFVNFDDPLYVYENPHVTPGLNLDGIEWAFTHTVSSNWHPLTMMSHMLDCQLYGLNAGWHHLTSVLLHVTAVILLFLVLRRMTAALWPAAFVAAIFAIHPVRVESVAWVAERKDVLSGLFFMLTLWTYARYVDEFKNRKSKVKNYYLLTLAFFTLGLMSKPMLVTLPFVLLLLDYWPLNRFRHPTPARLEAAPHAWPGDFIPPLRLMVEKIPLLALALASCVATVLAQHDAIKPMERFSASSRISNAIVSLAVYLGQLVFPSGLAVFYPYPNHGLPLWEITLACLLMASVSAWVFLSRQKCPWLFVGWLWYLGMLTPVIGLVQVGEQAHADRYTYLPQIGLCLMLAFGVADLSAGWRHRRLILGGLSLLIIAALGICARAQTAYWQDSQTLWMRALAVTSDNDVAHDNLGNIFLKEKKVDQAIAHYQKALEINSNNKEAQYNLGTALLQQNHFDEAIAHFQIAAEINPNDANIHNNLGYALFKTGRTDEAIAHYQKALELNPGKANAHINLGFAFLQQGKLDEAIVHFQTAVKLQPANAQAHRDLAQAFAAAKRFPEAVSATEEAVRLAASQNNAALAGALQTELQLYQAGQPLRKATPGP